ncbi:MAG: ABC transporter permease [Nocardioidaceae bacterium]
MSTPVLARTLADQSRSLAVWAGSAVALVAMYVAVWPSVEGQPSMSDFLDQMPKAFRALFSSTGADMSTPVGYVQVELLSFMGPLLVIGYAVVAGVNAVSGEEERHTLDLLLAHPVSRGRVVLERFAAMVLGTLLVAGVTGAALLLEGRLTGLDLPVGRTAATMLHLGLLGVVFGSLALALSAATGHSTLSRGVTVVVAVVAYVVNGLAPLVSWLEPVQKVSPFYQYVGHDPLRTGLSVAAVLVAVATALVLVAVAVAGFRRRDVVG